MHLETFSEVALQQQDFEKEELCFGELKLLHHCARPSVIFQEKIPSGLGRQAKLMSGLRFELDKLKNLFLMVFVELGGFYGEELYLMVKILLS